MNCGAVLLGRKALTGSGAVLADKVSADVPAPNVFSMPAVSSKIDNSVPAGTTVPVATAKVTGNTVPLPSVEPAGMTEPPGRNVPAGMTGPVGGVIAAVVMKPPFGMTMSGLAGSSTAVNGTTTLGPMAAELMVIA